MPKQTPEQYNALLDIAELVAKGFVCVARAAEDSKVLNEEKLTAGLQLLAETLRAGVITIVAVAEERKAQAEGKEGVEEKFVEENVVVLDKTLN